MNKFLTTSLALVLIVSSAFATGLNFQTLAPSVGDILLSNGSEIGLPTSVRVGTLTGNVNFAGSSFSDYSAFDSAFTLSAPVTESVLESTPNNVSATATAGTLAAGLNLWMLVDTGVEQGVFYLGTTPTLNQLIATPDIIGTAGNVAIGSIDGSNLRLQAVPEPSAFALLAGCFGLAWVMVRRRG